MRRGGRILMLLGIILALVAFLGILFVMRGAQRTGTPEAKKEILTERVVVAAMDVPARTRISSEHITLKEMPLDMVPPLAFTDVLSVTGRFALTNIYADQVILQSMVAAEDTGQGLIPALDVPSGMVAMAVPINEISSVAEAIRVGDHVDVIVSLRVKEYDREGNESNPEYSAQFTIQDVEILHIGSWAVPLPEESTPEKSTGGGLLGGGSSDRPTSGSAVEPASVMVILVEPQDALVMKYALDTAEAEGREAFTFVLRNVEDHERYTTEAVNQTYMVERFKFSRPPFIIRKSTAP